MKIMKQAVIKPLREIEDGELFRMPMRDSYALSVILERSPARLVVGVINSPEAGHPFYMRMDNDMALCASYGTEWLIVPEIGEESYVHPHYFEDELGTLFLSAEDAWMRFDTATRISDFDMRRYSLLSRGVVEVIQKAVPHRQWSIWQSAEELNSRHGQPLARIVGRSARPDA